MDQSGNSGAVTDFHARFAAASAADPNAVSFGGAMSAVTILLKHKDDFLNAKTQEQLSVKSFLAGDFAQAWAAHKIAGDLLVPVAVELKAALDAPVTAVTPLQFNAHFSNSRAELEAAGFDAHKLFDGQLFKTVLQSIQDAIKNAGGLSAVIQNILKLVGTIGAVAGV